MSFVFPCAVCLEAIPFHSNADLEEYVGGRHPSKVRCSACAEVELRFPVLFHWVLKMIENRVRKALDGHELWHHD